MLEQSGLCEHGAERGWGWGQAAVLGPVLGNAAPKRFSLSWGHVWVCTAKKQVWELLLLQVMSTNNVR